MTLLVGATAPDGIILAADKNGIRFAETDTELDETIGTRKIFHVEEHRVVYACAGDDIPVRAGEALRQSLQQGTFDFENLKTSLRALANQHIAAETKSPWDFDYSMRRVLLIAFYGDQVRERQLWEVSIRALNQSTAELVEGIRITGAVGNAARFFDHYFEYGTPVYGLRMLVAATILAGHDVDSHIPGLDITVIDGDGYHWTSELEKIELRTRWRAMDDAFRKALAAF